MSGRHQPGRLERKRRAAIRHTVIDQALAQALSDRRIGVAERAPTQLQQPHVGIDLALLDETVEQFAYLLLRHAVIGHAYTPLGTRTSRPPPSCAQRPR